MRAPVLRTSTILLRRWEPTDIAAITVAVQDPDIERWLPDLPRPYTQEDAKEYVKNSRYGWRHKQRFAFAVTSAKDSRLLGAVDVRKAHEAATAGYWTAPWARRQGVASAALKLASRWMIEEMGIAPVRALVDPANQASQRVCLAAGFELEDNPDFAERDGHPEFLVFVLQG